jgi:hypothetical protein
MNSSSKAILILLLDDSAVCMWDVLPTFHRYKSDSREEATAMYNTWNPPTVTEFGAGRCIM